MPYQSQWSHIIGHISPLINVLGLTRRWDRESNSGHLNDNDENDNDENDDNDNEHNDKEDNDNDENDNGDNLTMIIVKRVSYPTA